MSLFSSLDPSWQKDLGLDQKGIVENFQELQNFIFKEYEKKTIYPPKENLFSAFNATSFADVKVVIIGQDPYHGKGQANGLSFSVAKGVRIPPSLKNIYKELQNQMDFIIPGHGDLSQWAKQGVLLLNQVLTVEEGKAGSHHKKGWEKFTDLVVQTLNEKRKNLVFILWGKPAQKKASKVDRKNHLVLESVHPSPLSAHRGFFGQNQFLKTNSYLSKNNINRIEWQIK